MIAANYLTEQLAKDMERSELVNEGKMSQHEADEQSEEWEKVRDNSNIIGRMWVLSGTQW